MKITLVLFFIVAAIACNNGKSSHSPDSSVISADSSVVRPDTSLSTVTVDTTGASKMNADTSGMSHAK